MKMYCCGVVYSTDDPQTFWCIQKYKLAKITKDYVGENKVGYEVVYTLLCKKNGCSKLEVHRYKHSDEKELLEREVFSGKKVLYYLEKMKKYLIRMPQKPPIKLVKHSINVPYKYGKAIGEEKQRIRYINEEGWATDEVIFSPIKITKM